MFIVLSNGKRQESPSALEAYEFAFNARFACKVYRVLFDAIVEVDFLTLFLAMQQENSEVEAIAT